MNGHVDVISGMFWVQWHFSLVLLA